MRRDGRGEDGRRAWNRRAVQCSAGMEGTVGQCRSLLSLGC